MENSENKNLKLFKGAGWLIGSAIFIVSAIVIFTLSHSFIVALSASVPLFITLGISLEQKFQERNELISPEKTKLLIGLITFGFIFFIAVFLIAKYI